MSGIIGKINLNNYKPLREVVFHALRDAIIDGELKPGERLMEIALSEKMGVSRTPLREAIRKLELEGLVVMLPRKGAQVASLSVKDIMSVLEVRGSMDALASMLAAERINDDEVKLLRQTFNQFVNYEEKENLPGSVKKDAEFHEIIYKASRNEKLQQIANNLREQVHRFRVIYLKDHRYSKEIIKEHREILEAIEARDGEGAKSSAEKHIKNQADGIIKSMDKMEQESE